MDLYTRTDGVLCTRKLYPRAIRILLGIRRIAPKLIFPIYMRQLFVSLREFRMYGRDDAARLDVADGVCSHGVDI